MSSADYESDAVQLKAELDGLKAELKSAEDNGNEEERKNLNGRIAQKTDEIAEREALQEAAGYKEKAAAIANGSETTEALAGILREAEAAHRANLQSIRDKND